MNAVLPSRTPSADRLLDAVKAAFTPVPDYLNAAALGLPPRSTVAAVQEAVTAWQLGAATSSAADEAVRRARAAYARLVRVPVGQVAVGSQVSALVGLVAAGLPEGAEVLTVVDDAASLQYPFLVAQARGVAVRQVPLEALAEQVRPSTAVVAFSLVRSGDGRVADADAVSAAAAAAGALTVVDTTQAVGWSPVQAASFDVTVCAAHTWLCAPRGAAFLTVGAAAVPRLLPVAAGAYAAESVGEPVGWADGSTLRLADDARRFDVTPATLSWAGAAPAVELFAGLDPAVIRDHDVALANTLRAELGQAPGSSPIVVVDDADQVLERRLVRAGCAVTARGGRVRFALHVWNDQDDVDRVLRVLQG